MARDMAKYKGLTYFSAAHEAGLLVHPVIANGEPSTCGRDLHYDPDWTLPQQRWAFIGQIAQRLARQDGGGAEAVAVHMRALDAALLEVA